MATYVPIQSYFVSTPVTGIVFTGIDQSYSDLELVMSNVTFSSGGNPQIQFNGDTAAHYSNTDVYGTGSTTVSTRNTGNGYINVGFSGTNGSATEPSTIKLIINGYTNTSIYKNVLGRGNRAGAEVQANIGLWRGVTGSSTEAINSITIKLATGTFGAGTTFDLYGISPTNAKVSSASGGTAIYYDSTYAYHVFTGTGAFVPTRSLSADILVVAGGGGGGAGTNASNGGGGGGAGGLLAFTSQALTANTSYAVTVGAGGVGNGSTGVSTNGTDSQFGALTLVKGGGSGGSNYVGSANWPGGNGGSGGGGYGRLAAGGSPTSGQGYAGGTGGADTPSYAGAGGGGAGAAGANGNSASIAGAGGAGLNTYSTWATATGTGVGGYYAGGGAGGSYASTAATGGSGGGGNGGSSAAVATNGTTNTGGGGGASGGSSTGAGIGAHGGSGIVIVRYVR